MFTKYNMISYVHWTVHHLDSWIKIDQLEVTCFIISLFNASHVSDVSTSILRSLRLICWVISWVVLLWYDVCWCYGVVWLGWCGIRMQALNALHTSDVNTSTLRNLRLICWVISWVVLLWFDVCWCYVVVWLGWCGIRMQAEVCIRNQNNTTHEITQQISRKLLRMDVLTSETCRALNNEIIKQVT